jgi:microcystin-dependent protein
MKTKHIIIGLLILLVVLFLMQNKEHAGSTPALSNEAVQSIAKVYADTNGTATFNNTRITGNATFDGEVTINGKLFANNYLNFLPIASIIMFYWPDSSIPPGWAKCDGQTYKLVNNKTIKVPAGTPGAWDTPDLRGRFPLATGDGPGRVPRFDFEKGGAETHTLSVAEMPAHKHGIRVGYTNGSTPLDRVNQYGTQTDAGIAADPIQSTGGGQPHNNMPPFHTLNFIMKIV